MATGRSHIKKRANGRGQPGQGFIGWNSTKGNGGLKALWDQRSGEPYTRRRISGPSELVIRSNGERDDQRWGDGGKKKVCLEI